MSISSPQPAAGWTRRDWVKASALVGAAAVGGALTGFALSRFLLGPPSQPQGTIEDRIVYTRFPTDQWWNSRAGTAVRVTDFGVWQGATGVWRGLFRDGALVPGTGYPVLVVRVVYDDTYFHPPDPGPFNLPPGFLPYFDDPSRSIRIVVLFDRCTHLCCYPGWHFVTGVPVPHDYDVYGASPPTWTVYGQDPVWCICHDAQYDPLLLSADVNPNNGVPFVGARIVHGPGTFALPVIPVRAVDDDLYGGMADPAWYQYC